MISLFSYPNFVPSVTLGNSDPITIMPPYPFSLLDGPSNEVTRSKDRKYRYPEFDFYVEVWILFNRTHKYIQELNSKPYENDFLISLFEDRKIGQF